jgi:hypothetical protein
MSGPQLNENSPGSLKLRSGVTAYFVVEWEKLFYFVLMLTVISYSQNKQLLYNFTSIPDVND